MRCLSRSQYDGTRARRHQTMMIWISMRTKKRKMTTTMTMTTMTMSHGVVARRDVEKGCRRKKLANLRRIPLPLDQLLIRRKKNANNSEVFGWPLLLFKYNRNPSSIPKEGASQGRGVAWYCWTVTL